VLSAVLLAGCGSGPSQVGAAAIVGNTEIPIQYVQDWWDRVASDGQLKEQLRATGQLDDLGRVIVSEAVRHELLRQVATREGLRFDEAQVSDLISTLGGEQAAVDATRSIYDRTTIRDRARDQLLAIALARKYFDTAIRFDATVVDNRDRALAKARELAVDPGRARSMIEADVRAGRPAALDQSLSIGDNVELVLKTPLFSVPTGNVVAFPNPDEASRGQWIVAVLRERTTGRLSSATGATTVDTVDESRLEGIGLRVLGTYSRDIGVRLNPRYGVWSNEYVLIRQNEGEVPAIVVPLAHPVAS
jgi:hypothetical protein